YGERALLTALQTHANVVLRYMTQHVLFRGPIDDLPLMETAFRRTLSDISNGARVESEAMLDAAYGIEAQLEMNCLTPIVKDRLAPAPSLGSSRSLAARRVAAWSKIAEVFGSPGGPAM